jgi:photoactive yellow protein
MIAAKPASRQTLPAPSEPVNVEELIAERDRLRSEKSTLLARLEAREAAAREAVLLMNEVARLRAELARSRSRSPETPPPPAPTAVDDVVEPPPLPRPSPVPRAIGNALYALQDVPTGAARAAAPMDGAGLDFGTVSRLSPNELDQLPYGLICIDAQGRVVHYNDAESRLARLPKERVVGRNFFTDVAPCTRVREFEGEFLELVRDPSSVRVRSFDFIFRFRHSEQHVTIVMTPARQRGLYNIALLRRDIIAKEPSTSHDRR